MIEVTFIPTARDYAQATRWITRRNMGRWYWPYLILLVGIACAAAYGFILLLDAATSYPAGTPVPPQAEQGFTGAILFILALYTALFLKWGMKRFTSNSVYIENGYFLLPRTVIFDSDGVQNNSSLQRMRIPWSGVMAIAEGPHHLFIQLEPAFTLFIPKRIAKDADELKRLKESAENLRAESIAKT